MIINSFYDIIKIDFGMINLFRFSCKYNLDCLLSGIMVRTHFSIGTPTGKSGVDLDLIRVLKYPCL